MKILKSIIFLFIVFLVLTVKVSAAEAPTIINNNNVEISLEDYEKLKTLWSDNVIYNMKEDEVIEELEFYNSIRSRKTETYYIKTENLYGFDETVEKTKSTLLSKEEYDSVKETATKAVCGPGCWETTYKKVQIEILDLGTNFIIRMSLVWKIMPAVKSTDFFGIRFTSGFNGEEIRDHRTYYYNSNGNAVNILHSNYKTFVNGWVLYIQQPTDLGSRLEHYVTVSGIRTSSFTAYGTFQHATRNVSIVELKSISTSLSENGLGGVVQLISPYNTYYDGMQGVNISW